MNEMTYQNEPIGIIIWSDNFEELLNFYETVLEVPCTKKKENSAYFQWGNFKFTIANHSEIKGKSKDPNRFMINIKVEDIENTTKKLLKYGVNFIRMPEKEKWGGKVATFEDPENNRVNLIQII